MKPPDVDAARARARSGVHSIAFEFDFNAWPSAFSAPVVFSLVICSPQFLDAGICRHFRCSDVDDDDSMQSSTPMRGSCDCFPALIALCERHDALLLVDDAHGFGVCGPPCHGSLAAIARTGAQASRRVLFRHCVFAPEQTQTWRGATVAS